MSRKGQGNNPVGCNRSCAWICKITNIDSSRCRRDLVTHRRRQPKKIVGSAWTGIPSAAVVAALSALIAAAVAIVKIAASVVAAAATATEVAP